MSKPCKALIHVSIYLHDVEPTGELGKSKLFSETSKSGIKNFIIPVGPNEKEVCVEKVKEILEKIKELVN